MRINEMGLSNHRKMYDWIEMAVISAILIRLTQIL
jgi:hypothetical protein